MTSNDSQAQLARLGLEHGDRGAVLPVPLPDSGICNLGAETLLRVDGPEAVNFLQGQLTCDVRQLADGAVLPAAHLTPKGRAIATFLTWQVDSAIFLQFPSDLEETVTRRLRMFLMRSKATIEVVGDGQVRLGAWGPAAAEIAATLTTLPDGPQRRSVGDDGLAMLALPGAASRLELALPTARAIDVATQLIDAGAVACDPAAWRLFDIRAGLAWVRAETGEAFIPQMLNYDRNGGISFTKGCYVGQEVVARLHHLGEVKRRAYPGHCMAEEPPLPGTALHGPGSSSRQGAGTVVDAVAVGEGRCELLAVVERKAHAAGGLRLGSPDGPEVVLDASPYPLDDAMPATDG
jgi:folate-binding protein YgfZ